MNITVDKVRDALRKDDFESINSEIERNMGSAKAAFTAAVGYKEGDYIPEKNKEAFEDLSNTYIVEYVRSFIDMVDNQKMLDIIALQCDALLTNKDNS